MPSSAPSTLTPPGYAAKPAKAAHPHALDHLTDLITDNMIYPR